MCEHEWNRTGNDTNDLKELICVKCKEVKVIGRTEHWHKNESK